MAVGTGKYLLVYDLGGLQYSLYNSYAQIFTGTCEYPISGAAVSDSGMYAINSSSETYTSVVSLYEDDFSPVNKYNKTGYVMGVAINSKGTQLAVLTSTPKNGKFSTELMLCRPGEGEADVREDLGDTVGWSCAFISDDCLAVLCEDGLVHFSAKGEKISGYSFDQSAPVAVDFCRDGVAICMPSSEKDEKSEKNVIIVFDKNGKMVYNEGITGQPQQIARSGSSLYWVTKDGVSRLNLKNGDVAFSACGVSQKKLLASSETEALLCSPQKAEYITFTP